MKLEKMIYKLALIFIISNIKFSFTCVTTYQEKVSVAEKIVQSINLFKSPVTLKLFTAGVANKVYLIADAENNRYVLKIYTHRTLENVFASYKLIQKVKDSGIKVPATIIGPLIVEGYPILVTEFVEGLHICDTDLPQVAKIMARLHSIPMTENLTSQINQRDIPALIDKCASWGHYEFIKSSWESLDLSYVPTLDKGLIHGDFTYTNLLVDNNIITLLDFDELRYDDILWDIAHALTFYGFDSEGNIKRDVFLSFMNAYKEIRPLSVKEISNLFTHLKKRLVEIAVIMHYYMYLHERTPGVYGDQECVDRILNTPENGHLDPEYIVKKVKALEFIY